MTKQISTSEINKAELNGITAWEDKLLFCPSVHFNQVANN